jgi:colicin import membrane protein
MIFAQQPHRTFTEAARHAADTGILPPGRFAARARWPLIFGAVAVAIAGAAGAASYASHGPAALAAVAKAEPVTTGSIAQPGATPARRASTPRKLAEAPKPKSEPATEGAPWRDAVDLDPVPAAATVPEPKLAPPVLEAELPALSRARLTEIKRGAQERRLARLAKRKAQREARAAEAAAAERREKARMADAAAERREKLRAAEAAEERREKARRAVAERSRIGPRTETARAAAPAAPQPRVAEVRPSRSVVRVGLLTPFLARVEGSGCVDLGTHTVCHRQ